MRSVFSPSRTAVAVFLALTVFHLWPLSSAPWRLSMNYHADAQLNAWIVPWIAHAIGTRPASIFDGNIFAPERNTLAYSEPLIAPVSLRTVDLMSRFIWSASRRSSGSVLFARPARVFGVTSRTRPSSGR